MNARGIFRPREASPWLWVALIWLSVGMFDASDTVFSMRAEGHHHAWFNLFVTLLLSWLPWALASPLILRLGRSHAPGLKSVSWWLFHLAVCAGIALVSAGWTSGLEVLLNPWLWNPPPHPQSLLAMTVTRFLDRTVSAPKVHGRIVLLRQPGRDTESTSRLAAFLPDPPCLRPPLPS